MERVVLGLTEQVTLLGKLRQQSVTARIDTGATASSIDQQLANLLGLEPGDKVKLVKSASGIKKRPLVLLKINMNGFTAEEEFTIADRSHMTFPILIGQNILKRGNFLIDPNKK